MNKSFYAVLFSFFCSAFSMTSAQTVNFNYATSGLSTSDCNVFNPPVAVQTYTHTTLALFPQFNGSQILLPVIASTPSNILAGSSYAISYTFAPTHGYAIKTSIDFTTNNASASKPTIYFGLSNSLPSTSSMCGGIPGGYSNSAFSSFYSSQITGAANTIQVPAFAGNGQTYLLFGAYPSAFASQSYVHNVYVNNLSIIDVPPITGSASLCSGSQLYSITTNDAVTWTAAPASLVNLVPSGANNRNVTASIAGTGSGTVTLTGTVATANGNVLMTKQIVVGLPDYTKLSIVTSGSTTVCPNVPIAFGARYNGSCINTNNSAGITTLNWAISPTPPQIAYNSGMTGCVNPVNNASIQVRFNSQPNQASLRITAQNACGTTASSNPLFIQISSSCRSSLAYSLSPNPAKDAVTVTAEQAGATESKAAIYGIRVYDRYGVIRKSIDSKQGNATVKISLADLQPGSYRVSVFNGSEWTSKPLLIQK